jgi:hypothetical protein
VSIFAGFARRQAASRWAGLPPAGRQLVRVLLEMSSNFIQQTPHFRKSQARGSRLASLGGQFVLNFGRKIS